MSPVYDWNCYTYECHVKIGEKVDEEAMNKELWSKVDDYLVSIHSNDGVLATIRARNSAAGLPDISVSEEQGRFLTVLARGVKANMILEIGTLGGFSAVCLARALQGTGRLITLEADDAHARVAQENIVTAGLSDRVEIVVGPALDTLPTIQSQYADGFDLIFIDADKEAYPDYWRWALRLAHPGTVIVADNVIREGAVADNASRDPLVVGVREYIELAAAEPAVVTSALQIVGAKGHDGFSFSVVI